MNRNTVKQKIAAHNAKVQKSEGDLQFNPSCNYTRAMGDCLVNSVIYRAEVKDKDNNIQTYNGLTAA